MRPNEISYKVIGAALRVHTALGIGLLESVYEKCLCTEFGRSKLHFQRQVRLSVSYDGTPITPAYRIDFIVEGCVVVEVKCVEKLLLVHRSQVLTYLRLTSLPLGLLLNFNVSHMRNGIARVINAPESEL